MKQKNTLRVAFQNIGGFPSKKNDIKEDYIRMGLSKWDFDIFGLVETNLDWRLLHEEEKLWGRTREWWEHLHISLSHNCTFPPISEKQFGGTVIFTINEIAHRVVEKGKDNLLLGRWSWTKLRGKNGHTLVIITAYRPNPPSAGVMGVYAQHSKYFNSINRDECPRFAFLTDLHDIISKFLEEKSHIILMLDGNEDMHKGNLANKLHNLQLREVILEKHGHKAPSTYRRNTKEVPIDGIWASTGIQIKAGGYFDFDEVITNTDHHTLWIDIDFKTAFGSDGGAPIIRPKAKHLNNQNPYIRDNFNRIRLKLAEEQQLGQRILHLENQIIGELTKEQIKEYEAIDKVRCKHL
jgi:hypothetical protein